MLFFCVCLTKNVETAILRGKGGEGVRRILLLLCAVLLVVASGCGGNTVDRHSLTVHMLDVGDADCFLLTQGDSAMMIDTGTPATREKVISFLHEHDIDRLDYMVMTHPHADHMGAMESVLSTFEVGELWYIDPPPDCVDNTLLHERVALAVHNNGIAVREVSKITQLPFGGATVTVYPLTEAYDDLNDYSVVCMVSFEGKRLLMTGDATARRLDDLVKAGFDLKADALKIPHHGAASSVSEAFLDKVSPSYALISCGFNKEQHPSEKAINTLVTRDVTIYRTDLHGTVTARISREGIFWQTAR